LDKHAAIEEAFISSVVGNYGVEQNEIHWLARPLRPSREDHDGRPRTGALVAAEGGICNLEAIVQGEDRAARIGAITGRSSTPDTSRYEIVDEGTVADLDCAVVVEYGAAQRPAAAAVESVGMAPETASVAGVGPERVAYGSAAPAKSAVPAGRAEKPMIPAATTTAETAMSTITDAAASTATVATLGAIPIAGSKVESNESAG